MSIELKILADETGGHISMMSEGKEIGHIIFTIMPDKCVNITHTKVMKAYEGHGYGRMLVEEVIKMANERGLRIITPSCSYAEHVARGMGAIR